MKNDIKILFTVSCLIFSQCLFSQKDSIRLVCPFENGTGREPKEAYTWNPPEKKIIMISQVDTILRSCIGARVTTVNPTEDNRYEIVMYYKDFYFWYYGAAKSLVKRGDVVKAGQAIAIYTLGTEMEFRMFKMEDAVDPRELLECRIPRAGN
jgi:hypothetical protein